MSQRLLNFCAAVVLASALAASPAQACTTFLLQGAGALYFGRNLDWFWEDGIVVINPRDMQKAAFVLPGNGNTPAKWSARYGSVTFNQFGREMPFGGMNEAGLVVENMWLDETEYAEADSRPAVNLLQWIQYQLDTCKTVTEVISNDSKIRIESPPVSAKSLARIHYLVCDANGDSATIEFLKGGTVVHRGETLPFRALANDTYDNSAAYARAHAMPEKLPARLKDVSSFSRFTCAATRAQRFRSVGPEKDVQYAFETLDQVADGKFTVWSIVYDVAGKKIQFKTRAQSEVRVLDLNKLDFACGLGARFVDIEAKPVEGKFSFQELSETRQRQLLGGFLAKPSVKEKVGDLTMLMELQLMTLQGYKCPSVER